MAESLRADLAEMAGEQPEVARWYACYTRARHEKRVERMLRQRGFETFLPLVERVSRWKDRSKRVKWPLFPSYVLTRFAPCDAHVVLATPGVSALVRMNGRPAPIEDAEIDNIRLFARVLAGAGVEPEPGPFLAEGKWVEVKSGPLAGVKGVVVTRRSRRRVVIGLRAIGQGLEVDVEAATLQPIASS